MIQGVVNDAHEAVVTLSLRDPTGRVRDIEAVIDTGYTGFLTLPTTLVTEIGLPFAYIGRAFLANDMSELRRRDGLVLWIPHELSRPNGHPSPQLVGAYAR